MGILSLLCHWERMKHLDGVWIRAQVGSIGPFTGERNGFLAALGKKRLHSFPLMMLADGNLLFERMQKR